MWVIINSISSSANQALEYQIRAGTCTGQLKISFSAPRNNTPAIFHFQLPTLLSIADKKL
jgi:hypothetical protein